MQTSTIQQESIRGGCSLCFIQSSLLSRYYRPIPFIALKVTDKVSDMFPTFVTDMLPTCFRHLHRHFTPTSLPPHYRHYRQHSSPKRRYLLKIPPTLPIYNKVGREREGGKKREKRGFLQKNRILQIFVGII